MYNLIDSDISVLAALYCMIIIVFGSFFMLNLILAVIIQAFINIQKEHLTEEIDRLLEEFKQDANEKKNKGEEEEENQNTNNKEEEEEGTHKNGNNEVIDDF